MCGIIGYIGSHQVVPVLLEGLRRLEYRGYDSAGLAVVDGGEISVVRAAGKLANLEERTYQQPLRGTVGLGHTRWATHGAPTEANAHPQTDASGTIAVVHNGILENFVALRRELKAKGVPLSSDTDTELIAQLLGHEKGPLLERVLRVLPRLVGQYAVVVLSSEQPDTLVAFRNGPPLVVGRGEGETIVASDVTAMLGRTRRVVFLENGDAVELKQESVRVVDRDGHDVERPVEVLDWDPGRAEKGGYRHFMLKEIYEQPDAIRQTILAYLDSDRSGINLDGLGFPADRLQRLNRVHLVACGTSWHACLVGKFLIEWLAGVPTEVDYASEYRYREPLLDADVLVVGVTQSGETRDTMGAMELAESSGALLATVCNVRGSSAWRLATGRLLTQAGPEIGVASTKAFTTQLVAILLLALSLRRSRGLADDQDVQLLGELQRLPMAVEAAVAGQGEAVRIGTEMVCNAPNSLYLGRGILYPIALEGALKLKEISYLHAEGYPAAEMKHGPIALVQDGFPVVAVAPRTPTRDTILANLVEEDARDVAALVDLVLPVPAVHRLLQPIVSVVPLQLLAYHVALELGLDVDQPRNLAKSVTVE